MLEKAEISNYLKRYLNRSGISQAELSRRSGVERSYLNKLILGQRIPSKEAVEKLKKVIENN